MHRLILSSELSAVSWMSIVWVDHSMTGLHLHRSLNLDIRIDRHALSPLKELLFQRKLSAGM